MRSTALCYRLAVCKALASNSRHTISHAIPSLTALNTPSHPPNHALASDRCPVVDRSCRRGALGANIARAGKLWVKDPYHVLVAVLDALISMELRSPSTSLAAASAGVVQAAPLTAQSPLAAQPAAAASLTARAKPDDDTRLTTKPEAAPPLAVQPADATSLAARVKPDAAAPLATKVDAAPPLAVQPDDVHTLRAAAATSTCEGEESSRRLQSANATAQAMLAEAAGPVTAALDATCSVVPAAPTASGCVSVVYDGAVLSPKNAFVVLSKRPTTGNAPAEPLAKTLSLAADLEEGRCTPCTPCIEG